MESSVVRESPIGEPSATFSSESFVSVSTRTSSASWQLCPASETALPLPIEYAGHCEMKPLPIDATENTSASMVSAPIGAAVTTVTRYLRFPFRFLESASARSASSLSTSAASPADWARAFWASVRYPSSTPHSRVSRAMASITVEASMPPTWIVLSHHGTPKLEMYHQPFVPESASAKSMSVVPKKSTRLRAELAEKCEAATAASPMSAAPMPA